MQKGSEFEETKERLFTVHESPPEDPLNWILKIHCSIKLKKKKKRIHFQTCLQNERSTVPWENTAEAAAETFQTLEKDRTTDLSQARIHGFWGTAHQAAFYQQHCFQLPKWRQLWDNSDQPKTLRDQQSELQCHTLDYFLSIPNLFSSPTPTSCASSNLWFQHFLQSNIAQVLFEAV